MRRIPRPALLTAALTTAAVALTGCATDSPAVVDGEPVAAAPERLQVLASFYPLQYAVERVGGDLVEVTSLTPPGAEPHDLELSPRQLREVGAADAVVYLSGFQPAVDDAVAARAPEALDVAAAADLRPVPDEHDHAHDDEHAHEEDAPAEAAPAEADASAATEDDGHGHSLGGLDPHFWLDPTRLAAVAHEIADALAAAAPEHEETLRANADALSEDLAQLDEELRTGLAQCERDVVITGHTAFGYLAERYGFTEIGVAGIDPDSEPSPARMREIAEEVRVHGVTTVYTESAANPAVADALAAALDLEVLVLDPVETQADPATDYRGVMTANLEALRTGLGCA